MNMTSFYEMNRKYTCWNVMLLAYSSRTQSLVWHVNEEHHCLIFGYCSPCNVSQLRFGWTPNSRAHIEMLLPNYSMCLNSKDYYLLFHINLIITTIEQNVVMVRQEPYNIVFATVTEVGFMHSFMHLKQNVSMCRKISMCRKCWKIILWVTISIVRL